MLFVEVNNSSHVISVWFTCISLQTWEYSCLSNARKTHKYIDCVSYPWFSSLEPVPSAINSGEGNKRKSWLLQLWSPAIVTGRPSWARHHVGSFSLVSFSSAGAGIKVGGGMLLERERCEPLGKEQCSLCYISLDSLKWQSLRHSSQLKMANLRGNEFLYINFRSL